MSNEKTSLKTKITKFIDDTVTLDVLTLTGKVEFKLQAEAPTDEKKDDIFNWDNMFKKVADELKADPATTKVEILAYTHAEWDQDSVNYVKTGADADLLKAHNDAVKSAHEARMNAIKSVADAVEKLF